jgi:hypothetical protein
MADEQIIGLPEQHYCLTPKELRTMADAAEKMEDLGVEGDQTLLLNIEGLQYRTTFGWDDTGSFGVLAAWMVES